MAGRFAQHRMGQRKRKEYARDSSDAIGASRTDAEILRAIFQNSENEAERNRNARRFMEAGGTLLAAFGRYLSSRIDLLPYSLCDELAAIPATAPPLSPEATRGIFIRETGVAPEQAFLHFDVMPFESRTGWQSHHAVLGGIGVEARIIHPMIRDGRRELESISSLEGAFACLGTNGAQFREAVAEFDTELLASESFESDIKAFGLLALDAQSFDSLGVLQVYRHLTMSQVLVCNRSGRLDKSAAVPSPDRARMVCLAWLRQALYGLVFPVEPSRNNVAVSPQGCIVFTAGPFTTLPENMRNHVLRYLTAVAAHDAGQAYTHFAQMVSLHYSGSAEAELRRQFLQTSIFRDGFGRLETSGAEETHPRFTEEVLIHWRIAQKLARMDTNLISFYRGLLHVVRTAAALAPARDSLLEALYDLRLLSAFDSARDLIRPAEIAGLMERYTTAALGMPEHVDRMLNAIMAGKIRADAPSPQPAFRRARDGYVAMVSLLFALAAMILLLRGLEESASSPGMHYALVIFFVGFGLTLLRLGSKL